MAKDRKKRKSSPVQEKVVYRYTAELEEKKQSHKKLKIKSILAAIAAGILALFGLVIF